MLVGGDGSSHRAVLALGWAFGALQIALFAALILFGAGARGRERGLLRPLVGGSVVYLFVWTLVVAAYQGWLAGASGPSVLGFPLPTVLLIFAMWPLPVFYVYLYVRHFDRWVFNADDEARLRDLAERSSQR
ncbi:MAG: hypothetical protein GKS06_15715 [Acidobacteria bacterium]|nr:hypothetical protein [Acidobacteriota bacterium]